MRYQIVGLFHILFGIMECDHLHQNKQRRMKYPYSLFMDLLFALDEKNQVASVISHETHAFMLSTFLRRMKPLSLQILFWRLHNPFLR